MSNFKSRRSHVMTILAVAAQALLALPLFAQEVHHFDVQAASVPAAVHSLGEQSGVQIFASADSLAGKQLNAVVGDMTTDMAFQRLLSGTGLSAKYVGDRAVALVSSSNSDRGVPQESHSNNSSTSLDNSALIDRVLIAQVDKKPNEKTSDKSRQTNVGSGKATEKPSQLEEVVITGSRLPLASGQQQMQPIRSYTSDDIARSGQSSLAEFLNTLPSVSTAIREDGGSTGGYPGKTTVSLHGLPVGTTLVLLNGQRLETSYLGFFDLSSIPVSAVERIDVLPIGASAIYGADALGGAVNIILRKDVDGFEVNGRLSHVTGASDEQANLGWGKKWEGGSASIIGTFAHQSELFGSARSLTSTAALPADAPYFLLTDACAPGTIYSLDGGNLPGLQVPVAAIPVGLSGRPTVQQFLPTTGSANQCNFFRDTALVPKRDLATALLSSHQALTPGIDVFAQLIVSDDRTQASQGRLISASDGSYGGTTLGSDNPYNPFGTTVGVSFSYPGPLQSQDASGTFVRPLVGIRGALGQAWSYEVTAYLSRDRFEATVPNLDRGALQAALDSPDQATALNPFDAAHAGSNSLLTALANSVALDHYRFENQATGGQAVFRGPLASLPAGALVLASGIEFTKETQQSSFPFGTPLDLHRNTSAAFAELRVPLIARSAADSAGERLAVTLAGRYDHTDDFGGKATGQYGLLWRLSDSVSLVGGYGRSYKAPQMQELGGGVIFSGFFNGFGTDPLRAGEPVSAQLVYAANSNLKPETGDSRTVGLRFADAKVPGFEASVTYFAVNVSNYIQRPSAQTLINYSDLYPGAVLRAPPTAQDQQQGFPGKIIRVNDLFFNFGKLSVAGVDADAKYDFDIKLGRVSAALSISNIVKWVGALAPNSPTKDYVSQATFSPGFSPRWKGTASLGLSSGPVTITVTGRYVGRYKDYQDFVSNTNVLGNFWVADLAARYQFGHVPEPVDGGASGTYLALGAVDLFNHAIPFSYGGPYDPAEYDIRGRSRPDTRV